MVKLKVKLKIKLKIKLKEQTQGTLKNKNLLASSKIIQVVYTLFNEWEVEIFFLNKGGASICAPTKSVKTASSMNERKIIVQITSCQDGEGGKRGGGEDKFNYRDDVKKKDGTPCHPLIFGRGGNSYLRRREKKKTFSLCNDAVVRILFFYLGLRIH